MSRRSHWKKTIPTLATVTLTAMPFTVWCPVATAFFPPINNQNTSPPTTVVVDPPVNPPVIVVPPVSPPPVVPPVVPPPPCGCHVPHDPCDTPEPSTLLAGITGVAAAMGYRWKRRRGE